MSKVVYSYESTTSNLRVWAVRSPLSTWTNTTIINKLNFQIILNRPKPEVIKGNLRQLENLIESLVNYVDNWLNSPLHSPLEPLEPLEIYELKLFHRCHIPNLRQFSGLEFSTLELFDLISNLELLTSEVQMSPTLDLVVQPISPIWLKVVIVAIATVGISSSIRFLEPKSPQYVISSSPDIKSLPQSPRPSNSNNSLQAKKQPEDDKSVIKLESKVESPIEPKLKPKFNSQLIPQDRLGNLSLSPSSKGLDTSALPIQPQTNSEIKPQVKNNPKQEPQPLVANPLTTKSSETLPSAPKPDPSITIGATREPRADRVNTLDQAKSVPNGQNFNRSLSSTELTRELPQETGKLAGATSAIKDQNSNPNGNQKATPKIKIEVLKITGSPSDLQIYKQKLETLSNLSNLNSLNSSQVASEINIQVRWQNRQITEINVVPENMELTEFVRRSLLETFTDQDGSIDISLKIINP
ncbi:hypothetical protein Syn7502_03329 [Synechococcus sp. PCC 7502]|uniref:DUF4335 domain-containing protein n=1 Tax=Synechococcus sp. PCC 7502 TaxID=1173263 RepID=UPI00029FFAAC|nr:DUF4335 domain-containing protein [Synechococcus sp. PCC 7502]AFY75193.1 hypothetical protein Syn7502_03329 [Synechococcus sp. PCC 7502]